MVTPLREHLSLVELLLETEQRLRQMVKRYGDKVEARLVHELLGNREEVYKTEGENTVEKTINYIKDADPTPEGTYTEWLVTRWLAGTYSLEDLKVVSDNLRIFNNKRAQIAVKDIQQYRTPQDLLTVIRPFIKVDDKLPDHFRGRESELEGSEHSIILRDDADWLVVFPKSKEAAQYWGCHTGGSGVGGSNSWCITWGIPGTPQKNAVNQFASYTKAGKTPFIFVFDKRGHASFRDGGAYALRLASEAPVLTLRENGAEIDAIPYLTGELAPIMKGKLADVLYERYPWMKPDFYANGDPNEIIKWVKGKPNRFLPLVLQSGRLDSMVMMTTRYYKVWYGVLGDQAIIYGVPVSHTGDLRPVYLGHVDAQNRAEMKPRPHTFGADDLVAFFLKSRCAPATFAMEGFCLTKGIVWNGSEWTRIRDLGAPVELPFVEKSRVYQLGNRPFYAIDADTPMLATVKGSTLELLDGPTRDVTSQSLSMDWTLSESLRGLISLFDRKVKKIAVHGVEQADSRLVDHGIFAQPNRPLVADPAGFIARVRSLPNIGFITNDSDVHLREALNEVFSHHSDEWKTRLIKALNPHEPFKLITERTENISGVQIEHVGIYIPELYFETGWSLFGVEFGASKYEVCIRAATTAVNDIEPPRMAVRPKYRGSAFDHGHRNLPGVAEFVKAVEASQARTREYVTEQAKAAAGGNSVFAKMAMRNVARKLGD